MAKIFFLYLSEYRKANFMRTREQSCVLSLFRWHYNLKLLGDLAGGSSQRVEHEPQQDRKLWDTCRRQNRVQCTDRCFGAILSASARFLKSSYFLLTRLSEQLLTKVILALRLLSLALGRSLTPEMNTVSVLVRTAIQVALILIHPALPCKNHCSLSSNCNPKPNDQH